MGLPPQKSARVSTRVKSRDEGQLYFLSPHASSPPQSVAAHHPSPVLSAAGARSVLRLQDASANFAASSKNCKKPDRWITRFIQQHPCMMQNCGDGGAPMPSAFANAAKLHLPPNWILHLQASHSLVTIDDHHHHHQCIVVSFLLYVYTPSYSLCNF